MTKLACGPLLKSAADTAQDEFTAESRVPHARLETTVQRQIPCVGMPDGSASSRCDGMAVTRWVEDAALAGQSGLIFLQTTDYLPSVRSTSCSVRFDELPAPAGALEEVKTVMDVAVARDAAVDLRRVRFTVLSSHTLLLRD
jgi:hypothetical protein